MDTQTPAPAPAPISAPEPSRTSRKSGTALAVVGILIIVIAALFVAWRAFSPAGLLSPAPFAASFGEARAMVWYRFAQGTAVAVAAPQGIPAQTAEFTTGASAAFGDDGLVFTDALGATTTLIASPQTLADSRALAPDGSVAAVYNTATDAFDLYTLTDDGMSASYIGSVPMMPSLVAVGAGAGGMFVIETGNPTTFHLYHADRSGIRAVGTAVLTTTE